MSQPIAVLDIGSGRVTVLLGTRGVNHTINVVGRGECEYEGFMHGAWLDPRVLSMVFARAISDAEKDAQLKIKHLYIGVPAEFCTTVCNIVNIDFGGKRKRVQASDIEYLHDQGNSFGDERTYSVVNIQPIYYKLDEFKTLEPIGRQASSISANLSYTLCENSFIEVVADAIRETGVDSMEFCSSLLAEGLFLFDDAKRDSGVVLVDCGYITTSVGVIQGEGVVSQFSFSVGGGQISGDLFLHFFKDVASSELGLAYKKVDELKKKVSLTMASNSYDMYEVEVDGNTHQFKSIEVNALVAERVRSIARTIERSLSTIREASDLKVYLTGGGLALIRGARDCLQRELGRKVDIITPAQPPFNKPQFASSIGLLDMVLDATNLDAKTSIVDKLLGKN